MIARQSGVCSFHGDTLVVTDEGLTPIKSISAHETQVWARNADTGEMGWKTVQAQVSELHAEKVNVVVRDIETGDEQTIVTTLTHPFFVQMPQSQSLIHNAVMGAMSVPPSSEGHIYSGPLKDGYWVDAADMKTGYRLLNADASWAEVVSVDVVDEPMNAYNLTVADYHTYFVAANENAAPVWVHNTCLPVNKLRAEAKYLGSKKHGVHWSDQDAVARAVKENKPQGRFGSVDEIDYVTEQVKLRGHNTGRVNVGIKDPIALPAGSTSRVFFPDGSSQLVTHVFVRVNKSGTIHMYPFIQ